MPRTSSRPVIASVLSVLLGLILISSAAAEHAVHPLVHQPVPACSFSALGAHPTAALSPGDNQVRYVDFWASWCVPCAKAFPFMQDLHSRYQGRGLTIIAISLDETVDEAEGFLGRHNADFPLGLDPKGDCPRAFKLMGMPTSFVIDRNGIVRHVHTGFRSGEAGRIEAEIEALLAEP